MSLRPDRQLHRLVGRHPRVFTLSELAAASPQDQHSGANTVAGHANIVVDAPEIVNATTDVSQPSTGLILAKPAQDGIE
jgi:hypothetical protein